MIGAFAAGVAFSPPRYSRAYAASQS